ncbi:hypothetical protein EVAR_11516_1 [Eumeta japonica]|uniref:Uncharacterized protein n=1 Tax=Eumeta variegata TaxID=151549 RepID=A0A4C1TZF4_EUMVA|nr:hypothetical protein EVAR_11516_1 [Eumeta japonica]
MSSTYPRRKQSAFQSGKSDRKQTKFENSALPLFHSENIERGRAACVETYSVAAYWRFEHEAYIVEVSLIAVRTKVAPLKPFSVPRLELPAAVASLGRKRLIDRCQQMALAIYDEQRSQRCYTRISVAKYKRERSLVPRAEVPLLTGRDMASRDAACAAS